MDVEEFIFQVYKDKYGEMIALGCEIKFVKDVATKSFKARERNKRTSYYASQLKQLERRTQKK